MQYTCPILNRPTQVKETEFSRDEWSIVKCQETGFVFLANPPEYERLETEFAWEQSSAVEQERRRVDEPIVSRLSSLAKKVKYTLFPKRNKIAQLTLDATRNRQSDQPLRLLDIGCGGGSLMVNIYQKFASLGRKVIPHGIEVSKQLAKESKERIADYGGEVVFANAVDGASELEANSMDVVVMCSFLEHERHPRTLLQHVRHLLTDDGVVIIKVPNFSCWNRFIRGRKWCGFYYPDHVNYFTPDTLKILAEDAGFSVTRQNLREKFPLSDNMYAVLSKCA